MDTLFAVHARYCVRQSLKDPGKLGIWLVNAETEEQAESLWRDEPSSQGWIHERTMPHAKACVRIL